MFLRLIALFTFIPLIELFLLIEIGRRTGALTTILLVISTGFLGAWLARQQGLQTFNRVRHEFAAGRLPTQALLDGVLILVAGAVLLTPGLLTDLCGFALLTPVVRQKIRQRLVKWMQERISSGSVIISGHRGQTGEQNPNEKPPRVVIIEPPSDTEP